MSTHTEDENEALQKALMFEKMSLLARKKQLDERTTRRVLQQIALAAGHDAGDGLTVKEFLDEQRALLGHSFKGRTLERYQYALDHFRDAGGLEAQPLHAVTPARAVEWRDSLVKEGLATSTLNHQLGVLRRAFQPAVQKEWLERNPWDGLAVKRAKKKKQQREAFSFKQFEALLNATAAAGASLDSAGEWHLLIRLAGYSGQRRTDCVQLEGAAVDLEKNLLRFWRRKNKDWKEVPIHAALRPALVAAVKKHGQGKLLPALAALPLTGRKSVTDIFRQKVLPLVGIVQPYGGDEHLRTLAPFSFHSLRHGLNTWLNDEGVSDADRMELVGHADKRVSSGYTHTGLKHAKRALGKVPKAKRN